MNRSLFPLIGVIVVMLGLGVWMFFNFERVTEREEVGLQGEARHNFLLAATRLYQRMGVPARVAHELHEIETLPADATVVMSGERAGITADDMHNVLVWVEAGGHLIVEAQDCRDKDALLQRLQIQCNEIRMRASRPPSDVLLPHASQTLRVNFGYRQKLLPVEPPAYRFDDVSGTHLVHLKRGRGAVTVLADMRFMSNAEIAKNDHAEFAWQLVQFVPQTRAVLLVPWLEAPSLLEWLLEHAAAALAMAAALLAAWLWRIAPRFGPLRPDPQPARRRLLDHLRASGRFHWKRGGAGRLLDVAREACVRRIARAHPLVADLPRPERVKALAALTGIELAALDLALYGSASDPLQFTKAVRVLQRIDESLVRKIQN